MQKKANGAFQEVGGCHEPIGSNLSKHISISKLASIRGQSRQLPGFSCRFGAALQAGKRCRVARRIESRTVATCVVYMAAGVRDIGHVQVSFHGRASSMYKCALNCERSNQSPEAEYKLLCHAPPNDLSCMSFDARMKQARNVRQGHWREASCPEQRKSRVHRFGRRRADGRRVEVINGKCNKY